MGKNKAALLLQIVPYNVAIWSDSKKLIDNDSSPISNDEMGATEFDEFLRTVFINYFQIMSDDAAILFHSSSFQVAFENEVRDVDQHVMRVGEECTNVRQVSIQLSTWASLLHL